MIEHKAVQLSFPEQSEEYSAAACSGIAPYSSSLAHFFSKNKVVPRSAVNPGHLEPFNCKGLFTTTHAIKHRSSGKSVKKICDEQRATRIHSSMKMDRCIRLPDRNSGSGSTGIVLVPSLRTLFSTSSANFFNKVVPRSVVNPDHLEPFNCKGLFTTTHAIKHRSQGKSVEQTCGEQLATRTHSSMKMDRWTRLPDRNSGPGSIGIGLLPGLRTLFYELYR
jgi:hypothetical protein